ncbi:uncharacterized protein LOC122048548 [Zingiber officinale]|uniref:uncharacterized protein LOC122048548 n=1 Tax=Zingiber officinale TaxID=94328 RepID=UPI001C4B899F|nr:uncharacterized protein LOC122048548 [Zingiber officinale]
MTTSRHLVAAALVLAAALLVPRAAATQSLSSYCESVTVPQLCANVISKSGATTLGELTKASILEAASTAQSAHDTVSRVEETQNLDDRLKHNLGVCAEAFSGAAASLKDAAQKHEELGATPQHHEATALIANAVVEVGKCNDGFSENPGLVSPVADVTSILKKLISNSLALSVDFEVRNGSD